MMIAVIGILLAASATLVLVNYGGDYMFDAKSDAELLDIENGITNVVASYRIHEMKTGSYPSQVSDMLPSGSGVLPSVPSFTSGATLASNFPNLTVNGVSKPSVVINSVPEGACLSINRKFGNDLIPSSPTGPLGCFSTESGYTAYKTL